MFEETEKTSLQIERHGGDNMPAEKELICILTYIQENLVNGELPRDFNLPLEITKNSFPYADGAEDGIKLYHTYFPGMAAEAFPILDDMLHAVSVADYGSGMDILMRFAEKNFAIDVAREFQEYIFKQDWLEFDRLFEFAVLCLLSHDRNVVKYGLVMTVPFSDSFEEVKEIIRTLGLCNEFTIFTIFNMLNWSSSNDEIFALAKKVYGWGRIHAVNVLKPENEEIERWLLEEGEDNDIGPEY